jgi:hypothetical protein
MAAMIYTVTTSDGTTRPLTAEEEAARDYVAADNRWLNSYDMGPKGRASIERDAAKRRMEQAIPWDRLETVLQFVESHWDRIKLRASETIAERDSHDRDGAA